MSEEEKKLKEMSNIRSEICTLIERYNTLGNEIGDVTRIGLIYADAYIPDYKTGMNVNEYVEGNYDARPESVSVEAPGATGWFSSEFCYLG